MAHPVTNILKRIDCRHFYEVFGDWLTLMVTAHSRDEDGYMDTMKRYGPREEGRNSHPADHFRDALHKVMEMMQEDNKKGEIRDHLGEIYEENSNSNSALGQFFTPVALTTLMAQLTSGDDHEADRERNILDPACGSGRTLLSAIHHHGFKANYVGVDLDRHCVKMCAMNLLWRNVNAWIIHANSLTLECFGGWRTVHSPFGGEIFKLDIETATKILKAPFEEANA